MRPKPDIPLFDFTSCGKRILSEEIVPGPIFEDWQYDAVLSGYDDYDDYEEWLEREYA